MSLVLYCSNYVIIYISRFLSQRNDLIQVVVMDWSQPLDVNYALDLRRVLASKLINLITKTMKYRNVIRKMEI